MLEQLRMRNLREKLDRRHALSGWTCERCGADSTEIAHGISKGKHGRKSVRILWEILFGETLTESQLDNIIHHDLNTYASCHNCNDYFNMHISHSEEITNKLKEIYEAINREATGNIQLDN